MRKLCTISDCGRFVKGHGLCDKHYERLKRTGTTDPPGKSLEQRFWMKVDRRSSAECWPWMACRESVAGYGRIWAQVELGGPRIWMAHRVSYTLNVGPIPTGAEIDHLCHTRDYDCPGGSACLHRRCVNPAHLEVVTHHENALRRETRLLTCVHGHPKTERTRGPNGGPDGYTKCRECHRIKMQHFRDTGEYGWPLSTGVP